MRCAHGSHATVGGLLPTATFSTCYGWGFPHRRGPGRPVGPGTRGRADPGRHRPRQRLAGIVTGIRQIAPDTGVDICTVAHAADGTLHPAPGDRRRRARVHHPGRAEGRPRPDGRARPGSRRRPDR
ncbi:FAD-linked oxidase C-terminal domain-containing protein [Kocuria oceani]